MSKVSLNVIINQLRVIRKLENIHFGLYVYLGRNISYAGESFMKSFLMPSMTIMGFSVDLGTLGSGQAVRKCDNKNNLPF